MAGSITLNLSYRNPETDLLESNPIVIPPTPGGVLIASANFADGNLTPASILSGYDWASYNTGRSIVGGEMKMDFLAGFPASDPALDLYTNSNVLWDVEINFTGRMPGATGGFKFCKIHGAADPITGFYNNVTFALDYSGAGDAKGAMMYVAFGDGSTAGSSDTANLAWFDSRGDGDVGRNVGVATILRPQNDYFRASDWGTAEHTFKIRMKYNSGTTALNEVNDGIFYVEIDGLVYLNATNMFNRHWANPRRIGHVGFGGLNQSNPSDFSFYYDDFLLYDMGAA